MIWLIALCSAIILAIDYLIAGRLSPLNRKIYLTIMGVVDTLPIITSVIGLVIPDNTTPIVIISMWAMYVYMILAIARTPLSLAVLFTNKAIWRVAGGAVSCAMVALFLYGMVVTRVDYRVNSIVVSSQRLPKSFDGYRVVQISDLHVGTMLSPEEELQKVVSICNELNADMIAYCGDLVNIRHDELTEGVVGELAKLRATDGVYSITGNHDIGVYIKDSITLTPERNLMHIRDAKQRMGWVLVDDKTLHITRGADSIAITGIGFNRQLQEKRHSSSLPDVDITKAYEGVSKELFNITLVHAPQLWDKILQDNLADLTLSGHVHAMQMKFPIGKRGLSPSMLLYKRWSGLYQEQGRTLYINDGIGYVLYPMRLGTAYPEITLLELRHTE